MSSRRQVPVASCSLPGAAVRPPAASNNRTASLASRLRMVTGTIRSNANRHPNNESTSSATAAVSSSASDTGAKPMYRATSSSSSSSTPTTTITTSKESSLATGKAKAGANSTAASNAKPLWPSRSASHRVAPSKSATFKSLKDDMVSSTGTESSGVYSDSDSLGTALKTSLVPASRIRAPCASSASRITTAIVKTTSKFVRRPTTPSGK